MRVAVFFLLALSMQSLLWGECREPSSEWIRGADLAAADPALAGLPADLKIGYAPVAGLTRVIHPDELRRLATLQKQPDPHIKQNICFAWTLRHLDTAVIRSAIEKTLTGIRSEIVIEEYNHGEVPFGEVVFPLAGLSASSEHAAVWKGYVLYAGTRRFTTWARVSLRVHEDQLVANGEWRSGDRAAPGRWRVVPYDGPLRRQRPFTDPAQITGLIARRDLSDGAPLLPQFFETPRAIEAGDLISVLAENGAAHIETQGKALANGQPGDVISVKNLQSGRTYRAQIQQAGLVKVVPGGSFGLATEVNK